MLRNKALMILTLTTSFCFVKEMITPNYMQVNAIENTVDITKSTKANISVNYYKVENVTDEGFDFIIKFDSSEELKGIYLPAWKANNYYDRKIITDITKINSNEFKAHVKMSIIGSGTEYVYLGLHPTTYDGVNHFVQDVSIKLDSISPDLTLNLSNTNWTNKNIFIDTISKDNQNIVEKISLGKDDTEYVSEELYSNPKMLIIYNSEIEKGGIANKYSERDNVTLIHTYDITSVNQLKLYDVVIYDGVWWSIRDGLAEILNQAFEQGVSIITNLNDSTDKINIAPSLAGHSEGSYTFNLYNNNREESFYNKGRFDRFAYRMDCLMESDGNGYNRIGAGDGAFVVASVAHGDGSPNSPGILIKTHRNGNKWIHFQSAYRAALSGAIDRAIDEIMCGTMKTRQTYNKSFEISENGTYYVEVEDFSSNKTKKYITVSNIDKTSPTISLSQNPISWTNGTVTITANVSDTQSGIAVKKWASGSQSASYFADKGNTFTSTGFIAFDNGIYTVYAKDNAGNESIKTITISNIDRIAPEIDLSQNMSIWTKSSVTITAKFTETQSGIAEKKWASGNQSANYFANNGNSMTSNSFTVTNNGTYTCYAKDNAGNEIVKTITISNIDKTFPTVSHTLAPSDWTRGTVTVNISANDSQSGVEYITYPNGTTSTGSTGSYIVSLNTTYIFKVTDKVGNVTNYPVTISNIDKTAPTITLSQNTKNWTNKNIAITADVTDSQSGVAIKKWASGNQSVGYFTNNGNAFTTPSFIVSENGVYTVYAKDNVGNTSVKTIAISNIDSTAPTAIVSVPSITDDKTFTILFSNIVETQSGIKEALIAENSSFTGNNTVKFNLSDISSSNGVKSTKFTLSAKSSIEDHFSTRTIYIRLLDNAGNYTDYSYKISLIPKKPDIPVITSPTEDQLYIGAKSVNLSWTYNSKDEDLGCLPQQKAEIILKHVDSGKIKNFVVEGEIFNKILTGLENGDYEIKVKVYNFDNVYSESSVRKFRYNKFKDNGNVLTIDIEPGSPIRYISVLTESAIPNGTSIQGVAYYSVNSKGVFDKTKYVKFNITNVKSLDNIVKLPNSTSKLKIEYFLKGSNIDKKASPILDNLIVYAK